MFKLAGKVVVALAVSLVVWEILLRIFVVVPIPYRHDPALGWMPVPNSRGLYTLEGRGVCEYNEFGFRGGPVGAKRPGELRVVALGDSYTEAQQMDIEQTYPARLERLLGARGAAGWESVRVLNGGRSASSPAYCVRLAEEYKKIFQPDWVVLLTNDGNWVNIFDPSKEIYLRPAGDAVRTEVRWRWDTMSPLMKRLMHWRLRDLATFQYAYNRLGTIQAVRAKAANNEAAPPAATAQAEGREGGKVPAARLEKAVDWTVEQMSRLYPKLVVVHVPTGATVKGLGPKQPVEDLLVKSCARYGVPLIMMRDRINRDFAATAQPPYGFYNTLPWTGHLNEHGHALVAQALYEFFDGELGKGSN